jgi:hypothetical protein
MHSEIEEIAHMFVDVACGSKEVIDVHYHRICSWWVLRFSRINGGRLICAMDASRRREGRGVYKSIARTYGHSSFLYTSVFFSLKRIEELRDGLVLGSVLF